MSLYELIMILLGIVLTFGTAIFVSAEFALVALDPTQVKQRELAGDKRAQGILKGLKHLSTQLSGAQVGITVTTILLGYTTQSALTNLFSRWIGTLAGATLATTLGVILALVLVNAFSMVFGELVPKNLALSNPFKIAGLVTPIQRAFTTVFKPVIWLLNGVANRVVRSFGVEPLEEANSARSASELAALVRHSAEEGTLDVNTATLFTNSVSIGKLCARDVMTDRGRMDALEETSSAADVIDLARQTGHSRFPVIGRDSDDILGFVHLRRAIAIPFEKRSEVPAVSSSLLVAAPQVPETMKLAPLLVQLRDQGLQMAVVVDEYGGTSGIVTLEDVVEEIVGEVADEHDSRSRGLRRQKSNQWLVEGDLRPDEIADRIGVTLPDDGPYETVAGLILFKLGRMPKVGDQVRFGPVRLGVWQMEQRRISQVQIRQDHEALNQTGNPSGAPSPWSAEEVF